MKSYNLIAFYLLSISFVNAQEVKDTTALLPAISIDSVEHYVNQTVTICDKIYGGIFLDKSKKRITLLNMGGAYPKQKLTVLIPDTCRFLFSKAPETYFKYKNVCISGQILLYNNKYEIVLVKPEDIVVKK